MVLGGVYALFSRFSSGPAEGPKSFRIVLQKGRLVSSPPVLDAVEGDEVTLSVLSDQAATLHVHEYEQQFVVPLSPNTVATASFTAARAGRFPVHVIGIDALHPEVAAIQVHPR
jgi:hypothetical protein